MSGRTRPRSVRTRPQTDRPEDAPRRRVTPERRLSPATAVVLCLALASLLLAAAPAQAANLAKRDAVGTKTVAVVLATWGPQPFTLAQVQSMLGSVETWYEATSYGQLTLKVAELHDWVSVSPPTDCTNSRSLTDAAFAAAGLKESDYDLTLEITPRDAGCYYAGLGGGGDAWLNGYIDASIAEHELGHALGLDHSRSTDCALAGTPGGCPRDEYGDPYDVMGDGADWATGTGAEFNAFQRYKLGWLQPQIVAGSGDYTITPLEQQNGQNSLVVPTAGGVYWFEHREPIGPDSTLDASAFQGVLVHQGSLGTRFSDESVLLRPYQGADGWVLDPNATFTDPGVFTLTLNGIQDGNASVRFAWTDTQPPTRLAVHLRPAATTGRPAFDWAPATDSESGLGHYELTIDGGNTVVLPPTATQWSPPTRLAAGGHTLTLVAVDRAGNRSSVSTPFTLTTPNAVPATDGGATNAGAAPIPPQGGPSTLGSPRELSAHAYRSARFAYSLGSAQQLTVRLFSLATGRQVGSSYRTPIRRSGSFTLGRVLGRRLLGPGDYLLVAWADSAGFRRFNTVIMIAS